MIFALPSRESGDGVVGGPISITLAGLFGVCTFGWWMLASGYPLAAIGQWVRWGFTFDAFLEPTATTAYASSVPIDEQILLYLGPMIFFSMSMVGAFSMVSKALGTRMRGFIAVVGGATAVISFVSLVTGVSLINSRWWYLSMVFLSIPLALTLVFITQLGHRRRASTFCATCAVAVIAFLLMTNPIANIDNQTFYHDISVRTALTSGEIDSAVGAYALFHKPIATDRYYYFTIRYLGVNASDLSSQLYSGKFNETSQIILIRTEIVGNPFYIFDSTRWELSYNPVTRLDDQQGFSRVFDSGAAVGYISMG
jgi:hypothetical protein